MFHIGYDSTIISGDSPARKNLHCCCVNPSWCLIPPQLVKDPAGFSGSSFFEYFIPGGFHRVVKRARDPAGTLAAHIRFAIAFIHLFVH